MTETQKAKQFGKTHLKQICEELIEWEKTGVLCDGKFREMANMYPLGDYENYGKLSIVEGVVARMAFEYIVNEKPLLMINSN
jgi:hypothetical protein